MIGRTLEQERTLPKERYFNDGYFKRKQMDSLVSQLICLHEKKPQRILEVGPGNGFVSNFLKAAGYEVVTFDINENLQPDVIGNLLEIENYFDENAFDLILCAEVLEHLPFEHFENIVRQFQKISSNWVVITLPVSLRILLDFNVSFKIPFLKPKSFGLFLPKARSGHKSKDHHWELNYNEKTKIGAILDLFSNYFSTQDHYYDKRNRNHYFFEMKVK